MPYSVSLRSQYTLQSAICHLRRCLHGRGAEQSRSAAGSPFGSASATPGTIERTLSGTDSVNWAASRDSFKKNTRRMNRFKRKIKVESRSARVKERKRYQPTVAFLHLKESIHKESNKAFKVRRGGEEKKVNFPIGTRLMKDLHRGRKAERFYDGSLTLD